MSRPCRPGSTHNWVPIDSNAHAGGLWNRQICSHCGKVRRVRLLSEHDWRYIRG